MKRAANTHKGTRKNSNRRNNRHRSRDMTAIQKHTPSYPPKEINDLISHVIYINLDRRRDRRKHIERELKIFHPDKVTRLPAVIADTAATGCAKSHLKALEMARDNKYPNVLILEDDSYWNKVEDSFPVLKRLLQEPYDGILLGGTRTTYDDNLRLIEGYTTNGYIVNEKFYDKYIELYTIAFTKDKKKNEEGRFIWSDGVSNDAYKNGSWFIVVPSLMVQIGSYSNINKGYKNISSGFA